MIFSPPLMYFWHLLFFVTRQNSGVMPNAMLLLAFCISIHHTLTVNSVFSIGIICQPYPLFCIKYGMSVWGIHFIWPLNRTDMEKLVSHKDVATSCVLLQNPNLI